MKNTLEDEKTKDKFEDADKELIKTETGRRTARAGRLMGCLGARGLFFAAQRSARAIQILVRPVMYGLASGIAVYGGHVTAFDAKCLVKRMRDRCQTIRGAGAITENCIAIGSDFVDECDTNTNGDLYCSLVYFEHMFRHGLANSLAPFFCLF